MGNRHTVAIRRNFDGFNMRKPLGYIWLALASVLLVGLAAKFAAAAAAGLPWVAGATAAKWPLAVISLAFFVAPRASKEPPKNPLEHSDRTWFAKVLIGVAAAIFIFKATAQLL